MTIAFGNHTKWNSGTSGSIDTGGSSLIYVTRNYFGTGAFGTLSDSPGNTYTNLTAQATTGHNPDSESSYVLNPTTSATHTFTFTGGAIFGCYVAAFNSVASFDQETGNTGGANTSIQPGALNSTDNDSLFILSHGNDSSTNAPTADSSFTTSDSDSFSGGSHYGGGLFYRIESGDAGSLNPTISWTTSGRCTAHMSTWKPTAAAVASRNNLLLMGV